MDSRIFTASDYDAYQRDGYLIKRGFFTPDEADKVYQSALSDKLLSEKAYDLDDAEGKKTRLTLWYYPGDDIYSMLGRSQRMLTTVSILLGGTPGHYHSKLMQKEPKVGGAWEWHQDYGYWYHEGYLQADMLSVMVALTEANKQNGCLQVLKGSHKMDRVEHGISGEQVGIKPALIEAAVKQFELVHVELKPGDTLFFHSNLFHRSDANNSDNSRWSLITAYNLVTNVPFIDGPDSSIIPVEMVPDSAILESSAGKISGEAQFRSADDRSELYEKG